MGRGLASKNHAGRWRLAHARAGSKVIGWTSLKFSWERSLITKLERLGDRWPCPQGRRLALKTLLHFRTHEGGYFHTHPFHAMFSLLASFVLALLIVLLLVASAR